MIPKIIWQTHEWEYEDLPHNFKRVSLTWQNLNPDWEYKYHSAIDRAIEIKKFDKELYEYYMFADKVAQSDIWRYVVTYQHGGVYADMDSFCTVPLNYHIKNEINIHALCTEIISPGGSTIDGIGTTIDEEINNSNFAVIKKSFILKEILDSVKTRYKTKTVFQLYNEIEKESKFGARVFSNHLWLGSLRFSEIMLKHKNFVKFNFNVAIHSLDVKTKFTSNFDVNYYGRHIDYITLCKSMGWQDEL